MICWWQSLSCTCAISLPLCLSYALYHHRIGFGCGNNKIIHTVESFFVLEKQKTNKTKKKRVLSVIEHFCCYVIATFAAKTFPIRRCILLILSLYCSAGNVKCVRVCNGLQWIFVVHNFSTIEIETLHIWKMTRETRSRFNTCNGMNRATEFQ